MRRLALIIGQLEPAGGGERDLANLAAGLSPRRWQPEVFCLSSHTGPLGDRLREAGVPLHALPSSGHWDLGRLGVLAGALRRGDFHLSHSWLPPDNVYHRLAAFLAPPRPVITSCLSSQGAPGGVRAWIEGWTYRTSDLVMTNSTAGYHFLVAQRQVPPSRIRVVPQGIDLLPLETLPDREDARARLGLGRGPVALFLGWFRPEKNLPLLVEAAALLRAEQPDLCWVLAGEGTVRGEVGALVEERGLGAIVRLPGRQTDVPAILAAADLFVLGSDYEGLPGALLEALGAGLPAVVTEVGDCGRLVRDAGAGLAVPPGDVVAFAQAVRRLLGDPAAAEACRRAGKEYVHRHFGVPQMVAATEAVYEEVLLG